jgi:hypothetical protein
MTYGKIVIELNRSGVAIGTGSCNKKTWTLSPKPWSDPMKPNDLYARSLQDDAPSLIQEFAQAIKDYRALPWWKKVVYPILFILALVFCYAFLVLSLL